MPAVLNPIHSILPVRKLEVSRPGCKRERELDDWVGQFLDFNPLLANKAVDANHQE